MTSTAMDIAQICQEHDLFINHIGLRDGHARIVLVARNEVACPFYVLVLRQVRSLAASPGAQLPVRICVGDVGCFGLWLHDRSAYRQVAVQSKSGHDTLLVAIAREVLFKPADAKGCDLSFPG